MYLISWVLTLGVALFIPRFMFVALVGFAVANMFIYYRQGVLRLDDFKAPIVGVLASILGLLAFSCFFSLYPLESARLVFQSGVAMLAGWLLYVTGTKYAPSALDAQAAFKFQMLVLIGIGILMGLMLALRFGLILEPDFKFNIQAASLALIYWPIVGAVSRHRTRWFFPVSFVLALITIGLSASLTALVTLILSGIVFGFMRIKGLQKIADIGVYSAFIAIVLTPPILSYSRTLAHLIEPLIKQKHTHFQIWVQSWERIGANWPYGVGIKMTRYDSQAMSEALLEKGDRVLYSHNMPLQMAWELGFLGVILAIVSVGLLLWFYTKQAEQARPIAAAFLISVAISCSLSYDIWSSWRLSLVMLGLIYLVHSGQLHGEDRRDAQTNPSTLS